MHRFQKPFFYSEETLFEQALIFQFIIISPLDSNLYISITLIVTEILVGSLLCQSPKQTQKHTIQIGSWFKEHGSLRIYLKLNYDLRFTFHNFLPLLMPLRLIKLNPKFGGFIKTTSRRNTIVNSLTFILGTCVAA